MAATPQRAAFSFKGLKTGTAYNIDAYVSDVAAATVRFNPTGTAGTGSPEYWRAPEDVVLVDYAMVTGTADTTSVTLTQDGALRNGTVLRYTVFLTSLNNRPALAIPFPAGALVGALQNA